MKKTLIILFTSLILLFSGCAETGDIDGSKGKTPNNDTVNNGTVNNNTVNNTTKQEDKKPDSTAKKTDSSTKNNATTDVNISNATTDVNTSNATTDVNTTTTTDVNTSNTTTTTTTDVNTTTTTNNFTTDVNTTTTTNTNIGADISASSNPGLQIAVKSVLETNMVLENKAYSAPRGR